MVVLILLNLPNSTRSCKVKNYWAIELVTVLLLLLLSHVKQGICSTLMSIFGISLAEKVPSSKQNECGDANYPSPFLSLRVNLFRAIINFKVLSSTIKLHIFGTVPLLIWNTLTHVILYI